MSHELRKPEAEYVKAEIIDTFPPGYKEWADRKSGGLDLNFFHHGRKDYDPLPEPPEPMYELYEIVPKPKSDFEIIQGAVSKFCKDLEESLMKEGDVTRVNIIGYHEEIAGKAGVFISKTPYGQSEFPTIYELHSAVAESYSYYDRFESIYYGEPVFYGNEARRWMSSELVAFRQFGYDIKDPYEGAPSWL